MSTGKPQYSQSLLLVWRLAEFEASHLEAGALEPEHFFLGLLKLAELDVFALLEERTALSPADLRSEADSVARLRRTFDRSNLDTKRARRQLRGLLVGPSSDDTNPSRLRRSPASREAFDRADSVAAGASAQTLQVLHLLLGILDGLGSEIATAMAAQGVNADRVCSEATKGLDETGTSPSIDPGAPESQRSGSRPESHGEPFSERIGRSLTEMAELGRLPAIIGRKEEMRLVVQVLMRSRKNCALLIGEPGVGKTGVVEGLAQRIVDKQVPDECKGKRIVEVSMAALMAGTSLRGELEKRLQALVHEAENDPNLLVFIDEVHLLIGAGRASGSSMDVGNILKPALARGGIRVIGATTTAEYQRMAESDPALVRRFEVIKIEEPTVGEALEVLRGLRAGLEAHHRVRIDESAIEAAVSLTQRFLPASRLPDKAIDALDHACVLARMKTLSGDLKAVAETGITIAAGDVAAAVAQRARVPVGDVEADESRSLLDLERRLGERIFGQDHVLRAVSEAIRLSKSGIRETAGPLASFLFVGPSGTGKTELSRVLADCLFGETKKLIRLNMSEFMEAHSVAKLIGAPPGFIGHETGGQLTDRVRNEPYSIVLLDEVEKAHPRVFDLFLQVLDGGFLTDAHGVTVDFRNTVLIMTSNLGSAKGKHARIGFNQGDSIVDTDHGHEEEVLSAVKAFFRPEFLNRLDSVLAFERLGGESYRRILDKCFRQLNERLAQKGVHLSLGGAASEAILKAAPTEEAGARGLVRFLEEQVFAVIARAVLEKPDWKGGFFVEWDDREMRPKLREVSDQE